MLRTSAKVCNFYLAGHALFYPPARVVDLLLAHNNCAINPLSRRVKYKKSKTWSHSVEYIFVMTISTIATHLGANPVFELWENAG